MQRTKVHGNSRSIVLILLILLTLASCHPSDDPIARIEDERRAGSGELIEALRDGLPERQARAALAMGRIQSPEYAGPLAEASRSGGPQVRLAALFALGQLGLAQGGEVPDVAVTSGLAALDDADPRIAGAALEALGKLADRRVPEAVLPFLKHANPELRIAAALALFRCRFAPLWRGDADSPPPLPQRAVLGLLDARKDDDPEVRRAIVYAFSRYGQAGAATGLADLLGDQDQLTRLFAVRAIGRSEDDSVSESLARVLADPDPQVRTEAVSALAALGWPQGVAATLASDPSFHVRAALAAALAAAKTPDSLETLRQLERDDSVTVRAAAIAGLALRLGAGYREILERHLGHADWRIRRAAAGALGHLGSDGVALRERAMGDSDLRVQAAALETLQITGGGDDLLARFLRSQDLALRGTAVSLLGERDHPQKLEQLTAAYDGAAGPEWVEIREALVDAVTGLEGAEALLRRVAGEDAAPSVRVKARVALSDLGVEVPSGPDSLPQLSPFLDTVFDGDPVVWLETSKGEIEIRCFAREAPVHVASFVQLVREGFYDGLIWHRVVSNFVIQGGDPRGDGWGSAGYMLRDEINTRRYERGSVGMPKAGKDTGGGQLFITHIPTPHLDGNYTIFGQVVSGLDVVDAIEVGDTILRARLR
jgi:cyclophilin family peptidyl-prolyl cis-trans isomerase/HEAT repeat protein